MQRDNICLTAVSFLLLLQCWFGRNRDRPLAALCGCGEIGRRTRFRFWRRKAWGFKSLHPHHIVFKFFFVIVPLFLLMPVLKVSQLVSQFLVLYLFRSTDSAFVARALKLLADLAAPCTFSPSRVFCGRSRPVLHRRCTRRQKAAQPLCSAIRAAQDGQGHP